jgi:uroporphyrinogen-III decarboxylase
MKKNNMSTLTENWDKLTPEKKRRIRFDHLLDSTNNIKFISSAAKQHYNLSLKRLIDVYCVREPDRVPVSVVPGVLPLIQDGIDYNIALHDPQRALSASLKFNAKYSGILDTFSLPFMIPAKAMEKLNYKLYSWPGYGLPSNGTGIQFLEGEYMKEDEYDALINNPSDFWMRTYLPRIFGVFEPFRNVRALSDIIEFPIQLMPLAKPDIQHSLKTLIEAGEEYAIYLKVNEEFTTKSRENGFPALSPVNGYTKAPFDAFGDTLRGTIGIMKDMFRQPDKLLQALDKMADLEIESVLNSPDAVNGFKLFFALHKGADGWMSQKQFETFYWPSLKKVMNACINEGFLLNLFVEGSFNTRLESFLDFPKGSLHLWFDQTDIFRAKKILGQKFCIEGNIPSSLLVTGSPRDVKECCRKLIEVCGTGGGYILGCGAAIANPKLENLVAMVEAARVYGIY